MNEGAFSNDCPGKLVRTLEGVYAFVPDPLPPGGLLIDQSLSDHLADAGLALGELKGMGSTIPNPHLLIGPLRAREAILSSMLEGTVATAEELVMADAQVGKLRVRNEAKEVRNYVVALEYGLNRLKDMPVSNRLIREVHQHLMQAVQGHDRRPGEFRTSQNYIGNLGQPIQQARFVPPPASEIESTMGRLEEYVHSRSGLHKLIKLALVHYQFEAIHPFLDGNGRIGRLLIALMLCDWRMLEHPLLYMSSYFERNKDAYRHKLLLVSQKNAWHEWIHFFLDGIIQQSKDAIDRSRQLLELHRGYREKIQTKGISALVGRLVDNLFLSSWTTMAHAAKLLEVTKPAAQKSIDKLVNAGILYESTGLSRNRVYIARGILDIINQ